MAQNGKHVMERSLRSTDGANPAVSAGGDSPKELMPTQDNNFVEVNWESPKVSQVQPSLIKSTADLLYDVSPKPAEISRPTTSPLIQLRYLSPSHSELMSTPTRHQGPHNQISRASRTRLSKNHIVHKLLNLRHMIPSNKIDENCSEAAFGNDQSFVVDESTENRLTGDDVADDFSKEAFAAVIAQLDQSATESDLWTDDELFGNEVFLKATQAAESACAVKHKRAEINTLENTVVKKSGRFTFSLDDTGASASSILESGKNKVSVVSAQMKGKSLASKGDHRQTNPAYPKNVPSSTVADETSLTVGTHWSVGDDLDVVGPTQPYCDNKVSEAELFEDDDLMSEQDLIEYLDLMESQATQLQEKRAGFHFNNSGENGSILASKPSSKTSLSLGTANIATVNSTTNLKLGRSKVPLNDNFNIRNRCDKLPVLENRSRSSHVAQLQEIPNVTTSKLVDATRNPWHIMPRSVSLQNNPRILNSESVITNTSAKDCDTRVLGSASAQVQQTCTIRHTYSGAEIEKKKQEAMKKREMTMKLRARR